MQPPSIRNRGNETTSVTGRRTFYEDAIISGSSPPSFFPTRDANCSERIIVRHCISGLTPPNFAFLCDSPTNRSESHEAPVCEKKLYTDEMGRYTTSLEGGDFFS